MITMQSITLQLPETILQQAQVVATLQKRSLEDVLTKIITATLPDLHDVPLELRSELAGMTWLNDAELWQLAKSTMSVEQQALLSHLSQQDALSSAEQETLAELRRIYGRVTLRKARAYALLSLRGGRLLLAEHGSTVKNWSPNL